MNKLDELYNKAIAASAGRKEAAQKNVNEALSAIFAEIPSLDQIRVRGWTPGFNDGDPCTHHQEAAVGNYDPWGNFEDCDEDDEDEERPKDEQDINDEAHPEHVTYEKAHKIVEALDDDFAILFNTNFELSISRSDAKLGFTIHSDDYDCGY